MNKELIGAAVARRLTEVREGVNRLEPERFGEGGLFLSSVKEILHADLPDLKTKLSPFTVAKHWCSGDTDCLTALRVLSSHGQQTKPAADHPSVAEFLKQLKTKTSARENVFASLVERYAWPPNCSFEAESEIREYLLMRLMTTDRAHIEKHSWASIDADELLLKLNLVSVHACVTTDLRFLDALNYYYELLPATLYPESENGWLLVSWLAFYARALTAWS